MAADAGNKIMREHGAHLVQTSKHELVSHLTTADIDELGATILSKASDSFLDAALEKRLSTIASTPLINALARAKRLGYEPDDIEETSAEDAPAPASQQTPPFSLQANPSANGAVTQPNTVGQCSMCNRTFHEKPAFNYVR